MARRRLRRGARGARASDRRRARPARRDEDGARSDRRRRKTGRRALGFLDVVYVRPGRARRRRRGRAHARGFVAQMREARRGDARARRARVERAARARSTTAGDSSRSSCSSRRRSTSSSSASRPADGPTFGFVHVQTDDVEKVKRDAAKVLPRLEPDVEVEGKRWVARALRRDRRAIPTALKALAKELSYTTGGVVLSLGIERGAVVRYDLFDRGADVDEYLSVPEYFGPLPPGDAYRARRERDGGRAADRRRPEARARGGPHRGLARRAAARPGAVRTDRNR